MLNQEKFTARDPLTLAWCILVLATGIGWWLGHEAQIDQDGARLSIAGVILTAFFKAWIVGYQFMELKRAPAWLRYVYNIWIVGVCATLMFICLR